MFGKIGLATALVVPFKAKIAEIVPPVKGELRVKDEAAATKSSAAPTRPSSNARGGAPGGSGDGSGGSTVPREKGLTIEAIMAVVEPDGDATAGGADGAADLESGLGGAAAAPRSKTGAPCDEQEDKKDAEWAGGGGGGRLSRDGGVRGSGDDGDGDSIVAAAAGFCSRRLSLPTVEEGKGEQQQQQPTGGFDSGLLGGGGGGGQSTFPGRKNGAHEVEDEKSEDFAPSHGGM